MITSLAKTVLIPIHRAGWPFIALFAAVALVLLTQSTLLGVAGLVATAWCVYFFRDPERMTPVRHGLIVSAADGLVSSVDAAVPPEGLGLPDRPLTRISVFLNIFDVHINRMPIDGTVGGDPLPAGQVPQRRPGQGQRRQRTQRHAHRHRRRAARWWWSRSPA